MRESEQLPPAFTAISAKHSHKTSKIWHPQLSDFKYYKRVGIGIELTPSMSSCEINRLSRIADALKCSQSITVSEVRGRVFAKAGRLVSAKQGRHANHLRLVVRGGGQGLK